ncbi:hypothetical protein HaLaN_05304 [Haematococcus lacustris]|uniref:Uncharacterized protein n=1 Tax=Haematococcus lacustris TaxID=44745 RepID=A0A699YIM8_HAELA|nr:hypothetical protein HaLaN_05304 [Haematococcus lacustris]
MFVVAELFKTDKLANKDPTSTGISLEANLKHITVTRATWDAVWEVYLDPNSQEATQPAASEPGPSTPPPAKRSKRTKAEGPSWGMWLDRDTNSCLNFQRNGKSMQRPLELCQW